VSGSGTHLTLFEERCDRCGACTGVCPKNALKVGAAFIYVDWRVCDGCLMCVEVCDRNAIVSRLVPRRSSDALSTVQVTDVSKVVVGSRAEAKAVRKAAEKAAKEKKSPRTARTVRPIPGLAADMPMPRSEDPIAAAAGSFAADLAGGTSAPRDVGASRRPAAASTPRAKVAAPAFPTSGSPVSWSLADVVIVLAIMLLTLAAKNAVLALPQVALMPQLGKMSVRIGVLTFYYIVQVAGFGWVAGRHGMAASTALGLRHEPGSSATRPPRLGSAGLVLGLFAVCEAATIAYGLAMQALHVRQPAFVASDLTAVFGSGPLGVTLAALLVAVAAPLAEEIAFRGVVLPAIGDRMGMWVGIGASAALYALFHASVWMFVPMVVLGVALGWLVWTRRSLWPAVALHVLYNGAAVAAAFLTAK